MEMSRTLDRWIHGWMCPCECLDSSAGNGGPCSLICFILSCFALNARVVPHHPRNKSTVLVFLLKPPNVRKAATKEDLSVQIIHDVIRVAIDQVAYHIRAAISEVRLEKGRCDPVSLPSLVVTHIMYA